MGSRGAAMLGLAILLVVQFLVGLGSYGLIDLDEPRYAEGARSLREPGVDPFVPVFNGEPRIVKPILTYWLMAGSYAIFGVNEWAARFPSAIAGILLVLLVYDLGRRLVDRTTGYLAAVVASTSLLWVAIGRLATTDALLSLTVAMALVAHVAARPSRYRAVGPWLLLWTAFALAMATKGPVGVLVASLVILSEAGLRHRYGWVLAGGAALTFAVLVSADLLAAAAGDETWIIRRVRQGGYLVAILTVIGLGARLLRREPETLRAPVTAAALLSAAGLVLHWGIEGKLSARLFLAGAAIGFGLLLLLIHRREPGGARIRRLPIGAGIFILVGFFWYAAILLRDPAIRDLFLDETVGRFTGQKEAHLKPTWFLVPVLLGGFLPWSVAMFPAAVRGVRREVDLARSLPICWVFAVLLFFSLSPNKLPSYVAPATPGIALLVGIWVRRGITGEVPGFKWWILGLAMGLQTAALAAGLLLPEESVPGGRPIALMTAGLLTIATAGSVLGFRRPALGVAGLVVGFVLAAGWAGLRGVPRIAEMRSHRALEPVLARYPDAEIVSHRRVWTGLVYYGRRTVEREKSIEALAGRLRGETPVLVWIKTKHLAELLALTGPLPVLHEGPERTLIGNVD